MGHLGRLILQIAATPILGLTEKLFTPLPDWHLYVDYPCNLLVRVSHLLYPLPMKAYSLITAALAVMRSQALAAYRLLAPRGHTVIMFAALFCNLVVKFFHAHRTGHIPEYPRWILTDIAILLTIEAALSLLCYRLPKIRVFRATLITAAIICTWSGMNAGWLIRTGTQILPHELVPLFRDPFFVAKMVFRNLLAMPLASAILLIPSAVALAFFFSVLARPVMPTYSRRWLRVRIAGSLLISLVAVVANTMVSNLGSAQIGAMGMRYNCHARAVLAFLLPGYRHLARDDFRNAARELPRHDSIPIARTPDAANHNIVIVVLEGVQYDCTSLAVRQGGIAPQSGHTADGLTPYLATLADQGVSFSNVRSVVTHTTKALFALMTGRYPSASQDISETVPLDQPYASLATIVEKGLGFRTAFFQSATGTFESRPGLIHNLGFDKFFAREDLHDPNHFVGYLGADEFALLDPVADWIQSENTPFLITILCSVTHDSYMVPAWYGPRADSQEGRYFQTITYTDRFLAALDARLIDLGLAEDTIFCVVGDHGEAFAEHGMMGHERIAYDEVLRIAMCLRAPGLIEPGTRISAPVSSVDLTPTILALLGFETTAMAFDGNNALGPLPSDRQVFLAGWMQQGPAGYVQNDRKVVYYPDNGRVRVFHLGADPLELNGIDFPEPEAAEISRKIVQWRRDTIFKIDESAKGQTILYGSWLSKWSGRESRVRYIGP